MEEEIQKYIEKVRGNWHELKYVPEKVQMEHPEICIEAVKNNGWALQYVPETVKKEHPEICMEAVKDHWFALEYVPEKVQREHPEICIKAVKVDNDALQYVPETIQMEHPKICIEAVKVDGRALKYVPKTIQMEHPEICMEAAKVYSYALKYVAETIQIAYPEICMEAVKVNGDALRYVAETIQIGHPEICMEAVKNNGDALRHVAEAIQIGHPEICMEAAKVYSYALKYVAETIQIAYPEICMEAVKNKGITTLNYLPKDYFEKHNEIALEILGLDINAYLTEAFNNPNIRNNPEILKFMFEDIDAIKRIKEKAHFDIKDSNGNSDFNELQMDMFYHQMIKSIGIDEVESLVDIPTLTKEQIEQYQLQYDERLNELFEKKYKLVGEMGAVVDIFRGIDLSGYETKGKNIKFEIFKNLNLLLEQDNKLTIEELLRNSIQNSGMEINEKNIEKLNARKNIIVNQLFDEKFVKVKEVLEEKLSNSLTSQQIPIEKIIEKSLKKSMQKYEGEYHIDDVINEIEGELSRTRENGQPFFSHHITSQKDSILDVTREFLSDEGVERVLSKSLTDMLRENKNQIGKGWIRKLQNIPIDLSKDEYDILEKRLGINLESTYEMKIKDGINKEEAYRILSETQIPGVLTYNQVELMFSEMREPYSEEFKKYYKQNKEEILSNPEIYTNLSRIHNNFEEIIHKPEVVNRYKSGELTLDNILTILSEQKYENVRWGNERLAEVAAVSGLDKEYFEAAQDVYEITRKREGSSIPQIAITDKKYRGRILRADEPLNLFAGDITSCCQRFGNVGEGAMMHAATENNGAIFIIEELDDEGKVKNNVAQSWTWRNKSRLCYDNIEIKKEILDEVTDEDQKEIMDIYITAAKKAIETDEKVMTKLLKEGKITQEVYDEVVLTEVTCGTGYNDLAELTKRIENGTLKESKKIILPKEASKIYTGYNCKTPWLDSDETQITLASMDEEKIKEITERKSDRKTSKKENSSCYIIYQNARESEELKGNLIMESDVDKIKKIEKTVYREEQQVLQNCENAVDIADNYGLDANDMEVTLSKDGDWYMIGEEYDKEYYIADLAMIGGVNSRKNEIVESNAKIATFEIAEKVYEKMIEMAKKEKTIRYEATRDTSYINTQNMLRKGLIEVLEDEEGKFGNSDIEMNNVVIKPKLEELEEELKKVRETLLKLREKGLSKVKFKDNKDEQVL